MVQQTSEKISQLPAMTLPSAAVTIPVVSGGTTYVATRSALLGTVDPRQYGSLTVNDASAGAANVAAINAAIVAANAANASLAGQVEVVLPAGKFWIAGTITLLSGVTLRGSGIGKTVLYMSAANYPNTTWNSRTSTSLAIDASGMLTAPYTRASNMALSDFTLQSEASDGRVLYGIRSSNVESLEIARVEIYGFPVGNLVELNSILGGSSVHHCEFHDSGTAVTTYGTQPQLTAIEVDNNKVNAEQSRGVAIHDNSMIDLMFSGSALGSYGAQTDGINLADGIGCRVHDNYMRNVGEGIDLFAFDCNVHGNVLVDCYHVGVKFIHGASRNNVSGNTILRPGRAATVMEGRTANTVDNFFQHNNIHDVNISGVWNALSNAAMLVVSGGGTYEANNNTFRGNKVTGGTNMKYVVRNEAGTNNRYYDNEAEAWATLYSSVSGGTAVISNAKKTLVRASIGVGQATTSGVEVTVNYGSESEDTQGEFDTGTAVFTASSHRRIRVYAQVRSASNFTGIIKIRLNGAARAQFEPAVSVGTVAVADSFSVAPGDTVDIRFVQSTGAITLTANSATCYLAIEEVAG